MWHSDSTAESGLNHGCFVEESGRDLWGKIWHNLGEFWGYDFFVEEYEGSLGTIIARKIFSASPKKLGTPIP